MDLGGQGDLGADGVRVGVEVAQRHAQRREDLRLLRVQRSVRCNAVGELCDRVIVAGKEAEQEEVEGRGEAGRLQEGLRDLQGQGSGVEALGVRVTLRGSGVTKPRWK